MTDPYASEEETNALIQPDTRTQKQKQAAKLADENWLNEQGMEPQRQWVGLDPEEIRKAKHHMVDGAYDYSFKQGAEWAEAKLKEKNT